MAVWLVPNFCLPILFIVVVEQRDIISQSVSVGISNGNVTPDVAMQMSYQRVF